MQSIDRSQMLWLGWFSLCGLLSVLMGAFAAHGLKSVVSLESLSWWQTGCQYLMYHALIGILSQKLRNIWFMQFWDCIFGVDCT